MTWTINKAIPMLAAPDLEAGIDFYQRIGFAVEWRWPEQSPTHAELKLGACMFLLASDESDRPGKLALVVDDVDACYEAVLASRVWESNAGPKKTGSPHDALQVPPAPASTDYGMREFSLSDPWGNEMSFGSPIKTSS